MPLLRLGTNLTFASDGEADLSFLKELDLSEVLRDGTILAWAYDRRREAQMVLPWLYLGPLNAAKDRDFLCREGITMTLAVRARETAMAGAIQTGRAVCHEVAAIEAPDIHALIQSFPRTTRMINQHIAKVREFTKDTPEARIGRVLVFCETGNDRSAAVVAAYLMETFDDMDHIRAMQVCQSQRFCINFDDGIKNALQAYWDIIQAKRTLSESRLPNPLSASTNADNQSGLSDCRPQAFSLAGRKRRIEARMDEGNDNEDVDMEETADYDDMLRFQGRTNTPFQDA
jgi:hypothetical protein